MKRSMCATTLAVVAIIGAMAPAFAKGSSDDDSGLGQTVGGFEWITRIGGVSAGTAAGTPIAVVRQTYNAYVDWTPALADKIGGKDFAPSAVLVSLVTLPAAVVWGGVTGPYFGVKNGFEHGFNNPFTNQSFSLGDDYNGGGK